MAIGFRPLPLAGAAATPQPNGWHRPFEQAPLSVIIPVALVASGLVWCPQPVTVAPTIDKWQQPLSVPVTVAKAVHTQPSFVVPTFEVKRGWQQPLSTAPPVAKATDASQPFPFYPVTVAINNTVTIDKWQQPLSQAVKSSCAAATQPTFVSVSVDVPRGWYQALSQAPLVAKAQQGSAFVPFNTTQATPVAIAGMAWFMPLGTVARSVAYAPQQYSVAAIQFGVIAPPPPPEVDIPAPVVGGGAGLRSGTKRSPAVYVDGFARVRREIERPQPSEPQSVEKRPVIEVKIPFENLRVNERIDLAIAAMTRATQSAIEIRNAEIEDDEEAITLLLLS